MKHILFGLAAVLFASSVALADDQLTAQVKPASAEAAPGAPLENGLGNVKIIIVFIGSLHIRSSSFKPKGALHFGKL